MSPLYERGVQRRAQRSTTTSMLKKPYHIPVVLNTMWLCVSPHPHCMCVNCQVSFSQSERQRVLYGSALDIRVLSHVCAVSFRPSSANRNNKFGVRAIFRILLYRVMIATVLLCSLKTGARSAYRASS